MKRLFTLLTILLAFWQLNAQQQATNWYFGDFAGLSFGSGTPVAQLDGKLTTWEGCSSISTENGALRFYTDGSNVWNKDHVVMPNGSGLLGNTSSSQSAIIVPKPASDNLYYIFTIDDVAHGNGGSFGINYSLVDMNLQNWKGDIVDTVKNINLTTPMCEKVTAVGHANGFDTWVITQKWGTNDIYAYLITNQGVDHTPVISTNGLVIAGGIDNAKGYMKVSPNGSILAKANAGMHSVEIFDFNNVTGRVTNPRVIPGMAGEPYGIEFSPDNKLLYVNTWKNQSGQRLLQYDLEAGDINDIIASKYIVGTGTNGALQTAPDNRIYVAMNGSGSLSRINQPNKLGAECGFEFNTISLGGKSSQYGLPPFITSFFSFNAGFYNDQPCFGVPTQFYENSSQEPDSVLWNFGDGNTSTVFDPLHLFATTGLKSVSLTVWIEGIEITVSHIIFVSDKPALDLGNDTSFCEGEFYLLDAGPDYASYDWVTGDTVRTITVDTSGTYWVNIATEGGCTNTDTVTVIFNENPSSDAGTNQLIVMGTTTNLDGSAQSGTAPYYYNWTPASQLQSNGIPNPETVALMAPQQYDLYVSDANNCNSGTSSVLINVYEPGETLSAFPFADPDTVCRGEQVTISSNATGGTGNRNFSWTSVPAGFTSSDSVFTVTPNVTTTYNLTVNDEETSFSNSVKVVVHQLPVIDLIPAGSELYGTDTIRVCVRDTVYLDAGWDTDPAGTIYKWMPSTIYSRSIIAQTAGSWIDFQTHNVEVTNGESGCYNSGVITIFFDFNECAIGIEEETDNFEIVGIHPNPNSGSFNLEFNEVVENAELTITDIRGQMIYNKKFNRAIQQGERIYLNVDFPEKGIYFITFKSNTKQFSSKLMVR
ncbi:MAG: hypothetical protein C0595_06445 [Marinilabiliales bacterium]|nr:MAG: hypothetical protein C0595_06445 [Marinilabiliales bacterium]